MSFSSEVKEELYGQTGRARHCQIAELAALLRMCGGVSISARNRFLIRLQTENVWVAKKYALLLKKLFKIEPDIRVRCHPKSNRQTSYLILVSRDEEAVRVLQAVRLIGRNREFGPEVPLVHSVIVQNHCCKRAFLRGAFLAAGSLSDPNRSYHFEISCAEAYQAEQLQRLIRERGIEAKIVQRKKYSVVYVKEGGQIVDLLGFMEARKSLLKLENVRIIREMRGSVNRKVNCETANINKTVNAAVKQIEDICYIRDTMGFSGLSNGLDEMARIRLQYPEATLKELGLMLDPPVGKSGVNHRLRKLSAIADAMRSKEDNYYD